MAWPSNTPDPSNDAEAGIVVTEAFERFDQRNDAFSRAFWDDTLSSFINHTDRHFDLLGTLMPEAEWLR